MNKRDLARLQRLIDKTTAANNEVQRWNSQLMEFCLERYGKEPGEIDADEIIDAVQGGAGTSNGMKAEDFDRIMRGDE
jgi:aspartate ammonia-lyase